MALLVDRLASWLQSQGEGTVAATLFKLARPSAPVECVTLYATGGYAPERYGTREHPTIRVETRAATPNGALAKCGSIFRRLQGRQGLDLGEGVYANTVRAMGSPAYIGRDDIGHLASVNLVFDLKELSG